jgi:hypothetical protein
MEQNQSIACQGGRVEPLAELVRLLPARRAFVVQVSVEADVAQGQWIGRVEHVVSGQARHFQTLEDLVRFIAWILTGESPPPPQTPGSA